MKFFTCILIIAEVLNIALGIWVVTTATSAFQLWCGIFTLIITSAALGSTTTLFRVKKAQS